MMDVGILTELVLISVTNFTGLSTSVAFQLGRDDVRFPWTRDIEEFISVLRVEKLSVGDKVLASRILELSGCICDDVPFLHGMLECGSEVFMSTENGTSMVLFSLVIELIEVLSRMAPFVIAAVFRFGPSKVSLFAGPFDCNDKLFIGANNRTYSVRTPCEGESFQEPSILALVTRLLEMLNFSTTTVLFIQGFLEESKRSEGPI